MSRYADERKRPRMIERLETRRLLSSAIDPVLDHAMWEPRVTPLLPATWTARTPSALDLTQPVTLGQTSNRRVVPNVNFNEAAAIRFDLEVLTATAGDFLVVTRGSGTNARILAEIDLDLAADGTQWAAIPNELAFGQDDVVFEIRSGNEQPASTIRLSNLSTAGDLAGVDGDRRQELLAGLDALPELFRAVNERPEFDVALPVSAGTARELIDIEGTLENFLISPIRTYLTSEANPTVDGLVAGLSDGSLIGAPSDAQVNLFASAAEDEDQFELRVELFYSTTVFEQLDLGDAARDSGLLSNSGEIETDITIRAQLDIGLAITDGLALPGSFRVVLEEIETEAVATRLESGSSLQVGAFEGVVNETAFNPFSFRTVVVPTSMEAVAIDSLEQLTGDDFFPQVRDADVGVNLIFTLSTIDVSRSLFLSTPDAFTQPFGPSSSGEQVLAVFNRLSVDEIADALLGLRDWLDGLSSASALDVSLPFVESDRLGELLDWGGVFEETFVDPLVNEDGSAKFSSITDLVDRVGTNVSEVYDEGSDTLEFRFQFDNENAELFSGLPADFDFSLGKLDRIQASSLIRIEPSVNGRLRVGFDLSDDIGTEQITPGTLLTDLNNGSGIAAPADRREFLIVTSDAARIPVRLGTVNVLGDVLSAIDSAPGANGRLAVSVDSEVGNLVVTDLTTGNATFSIVGTGGSFAAAGLGLAGQPAELDDQARPVIRGASLRGDGAIARSYVVGDAGSQLGSSIVIEDDGPLVLDATLGLVDISVSSGLLNATAFAELNIAEPGLPGGRIPLGQLLDGTSGVEENLNTGGNGFVVLPISETIDGVIGSPQITVNWSDSDLATGDSGNNDPTASASVSYNSDASPLEGLAQLTTADIFASARGAAQAVLQGPFGLDVDVPVVDATLGELTGIAAAFEDFERRLAQLEAQNRDDWTFATLATAIADSLSVVDTAVATVRFNQNQSALGSSRGLRFDLDFNDTSSISESVSVATAAGDIRDVASAAPLTGTSTVAGQITFGTTNGLPVIGDASRIDFVIEARNESLAIPANLGAAGILIQPAPGEQSFAVFDADGLPGGAGATLDYVLQDRFGFDFYELGDPSSLPSSAQSTAVAGANLPVFLPGQSTPFGDPISLLQPVGPGSSDVGPTRSAARSARATFDTLLPPVDLTQAVDALRTALPDGFQRLGTRLATETSNLRVPIVNDGIQTSIDQLNAFGQAFKVEADALAADGTLTPAEASTAINATFTDLGWSASSVTGPIFLGDGGVTYDLTLRRSLAPIGTTDFDIGLPALELDLGSANVDLSTGLDLDLTIGLDPDDGFYFSTFGNVGGLLTASAQASGFDALGELNQLKVRAVNTPGGEFEAGIGLSIDLLEPSSDDRLTLVELSDAATSDILGINVTSYAPGRPTGVDLDLDLAAGFDNPQQASLDTTLRVDWTIATFAASGSQPPTFAGQPTVRYENVVVDFDTFLRSTLGPTLDTIGDVLGPVRPIIEVLAEPIPVLSDLSGGPITLATLAELYGDIELDGFINAADRLFDLIDVADNPANSAIDVGTFEFNLDPSATSLVGVAVGSTPPSQAPVDQVRAVSEALTNFFVEDNEAFGLTFPILNDPSSISNLLLGRDVDLIEFDVPKLQIEFGFDQFYPIIGPIGATFRGNIGASADLTFGLDSAAFLDGNNILEGLFVDDLDASGRDVTEVRLFGSITAGASFNLAVAEAGVDGGIFANVDLNLNDPNNDGKVRLQEIQDNFSLAPVYVFDVSGELTAGLVAFAEVDLFFWERRWERRFAEVTLLDFNLSRPDGSTFNPGDVTPDGTLTLTSSGGSDEPARDSAARNNSPTAFRYRIIPGENPGDVFIQTRGNLFERNGVRNLRFDGSSGDDSIFVDPDVQLLPGGTIELNGGGGDDTISGGTQPSVLRGGPGDDVLTAGGGRVSLFGGTGNDQLTGSTLDDFLDGGPDDDFIDGSAGNDELLGGDGDDLLFGNLGNDTLRGGAGVDELSGDAGNDLLTSDAGVVFRAETIFGGAGNDTIVGGQNIEGGRGDDEITASTSGRGATVFGGVGNDAITGTPDADALYGDDSVLGGTGNDVITALDGDDLIITHNGNNTVDAGAGNDSVEGGLNVDVVTGGAGDDFIQLSSGNDTATGNAGLDTIAGGAGNDDIDGGTDADVLSGGGLDDLVVGGEGDDTIAGNAGDDTLVGQGGNDRITGDDTDEGFGGNDSLFGGPGSDILRGGGGNDQLHGNAGIDELFGGDGNDSLFGGTQTDRLDDGRGDDLIRGGTDADLLILDVFDPTANDDFEGFGGNGLAFVNGNIVPDTGNDDSATATDRLVYLGSEGFDDVEVLQVDTPSGTSLQFIYVFQGNGFFLREVAWRALDGTPRFRQVELLLGSGNDVAIIDNSVDTTGVAIPGTSQFVFSIQGGPGNDTIIGSDNAEQLIGGPGSDELFGNGGDDRLWGDDVGGGDRVFDVNRLFGGGGNDDLIGGEGRNFTFAWSRDPLASGTFQPILVNGNVEETGIDRMLGGPADDVFYGAVAPSFIFGNGGNDVIIDTAGEAVSAGTFFADGFADYAQDLDGVWYIAGSNSIKDEIEVTSDVDGVLVDITQFEDAGGGVLQVADQVTRRPDVGQGRANSVEVLRAEFLAAGGISGLAAANNEDDLLDTDRGWAGGRAGTEGVNDFDVIIVDAFGGNDEVTVQGNVPYAVWLYGGEGNDTLTLNSNRSVQPDFLEGPLDPNGNGQNDTRQTASDLGVISGATQFVGLSIHTGLPPADQDWFDFTLAQNAGANDRLILNSLANRDDLLVTVFDGLTEIGTSDATDPNGVSLAGLVAGQTYTLHVRNSAAGGPGAITLYDFNFALGSGDPSQNSIDLSPGLVVSNRDVLFGGPGNDTLVGGLGEDWVFGGPGDDDLAGGRDGLAIDLISGDDGQDTLRLTPGQLPDGVTVSSIASGDILRGDAGGDTVLYEGDEDGTTSVPDFAVLDYNPLFDIYILTAYVWDQSTGNFELIPGTSTRRQVYQAFDATAPVTVDLGDSNDFFSAVSSEQLMDDGNLYGIPIGGPGLTVIADDGRDSLTGGGGDDTIRGGDGDDQLTGSDGRDVIFGEDDNDTIDGGGFRNGGFQDVQLGIELLDGGFGNDTIFGRFGDDSIVGGQGSDVLEGSEGDDTINGNDGNDQMFGGPGADHIETGSGTNFVEGGSQDDSIIGGNNNDQLVGGGGNDSIVANGGDDSVWGGEGNDVIEGRDGRDVLDGGDGGTSVNTGNDSIFGGADDDSIYGADGRDTLFGNDGNDLIDGGNGSSYLDVHPLGGGFESLFGGRGQDTLFGRGGNDSVDGGDGADTLYGGDGSDRLVGGNEETFFSQNDLIFGDLPTVVVWSDGRTDAPFPSNQDDFIDGGLGEDLLFGQGGDDTVIGGSGNDELVGGLGNDLLQGDDGVGGEDGSDLFWARDANVGFGEDLFLDTVVGGDPAGAIDFDFDEVRTVNRFGNGTIVDVLIRVDSVLPAGAVGDFSRPAVFTAANPTWVLPDLNADRSSTRQAPPVNAISGLRTGSDQHELSAVGSRPPQVDQRAFESLFAAELDEETVL